mgnify:CR=1 FL=1
MGMLSDETWRLHCLGWTVPEIADRLTMTPREVRKRIEERWKFDYDGTVAFGGAEEDRRVRKRE